MRKIALLEGIHSSVLGFGCAPILGSVGAKESLRAISCAVEHGVNHFDIARSYGYGAAEEFVGKALKSKRHQLIFASKFGIKANLKAKILSPLKPLIRQARNFLPKKNSSESALPNKPTFQVADSLHYRITLNSDEMTKSLEESLRALTTDYLDYFFIHEPLSTITNMDELCNTAYQLKKQGKIRGFGIAFYCNQKEIHKSYLDSFDILQFNNSSIESDYHKTVEERGLKPNILFSPLKGGISNKKTPSEKLITLSHDFSNSVILCSMFNEKHIKDNCLLFS